MSKYPTQDALDLSFRIQPLLKGCGPERQGAALADLVSLWLAGHVPEVRDAVFDEWKKVTLELVAPSEAQLRERAERQAKATVTRDPNFPVEGGALMEKFTTAANGYTIDTVFQAAVNFLCNVLVSRAVAEQRPLETLESYCINSLGPQLSKMCRENYGRPPQPGDVPVRKH